MVCEFLPSEEQSQTMFKQNSLPPKLSLEHAATNNDDIDKKRRQLLIRSAKRPFKRSRLVQKQCLMKEEDETDTVTTASISSSSTIATIATNTNTITNTKATMSPPKSPKQRKSSLLRRHKKEKPHKKEYPRKRRMVSIETKYNTTNFVPSHRDLSDIERRSYYFQRDEYVGIKRNIQRTIEFLRSPNDTQEDEHCARGLECVAVDRVNEHKKKTQKVSKTAVFRFQENIRRTIGNTSLIEVDIEVAHEASLALADVYKQSTSQCENIARRWGHFDAIDAGIDPTTSVPTVDTRATAPPPSHNKPAVDNNISVDTTVDNNASLSSLSYDGDDGEEEGFDSLPDGLLNF